jgi:hypothetical protein
MRQYANAYPGKQEEEPVILEPAVEAALRTVLGLLVDGEYEVLAAMTKGRNLSAAEMRDAVESYGRTLVLPPGGKLPADLDVFEVNGSFPRRLAAVMSLTTLEEGRSDLSVELTLNEVAPGFWFTELDNIHVM